MQQTAYKLLCTGYLQVGSITDLLFYAYEVVKLKSIKTLPSQKMKITYFVSLERRNQQIFSVNMVVEDISERLITLVMPAWTPGSYRIRDFSGRVRRLIASDASGGHLKVQKTDKSSWRVYNGDSRSAVINYEVFSGEITARTSFVDHRHALINGASLFLYVDGYIEQTSEIAISVPEGWIVTTVLERISENRFRSINYDILVDSPLLIGDQKVISFKVDGKDHDIAVSGKMVTEPKNLAADVEKICNAAAAMMGGVPAKKYCFILEINGSGGGLEHMNSTVIMVDRFSFADPERYRKILSTFAHEYFHMWNVKRIRPIELGTFNYRSENYTGMLWLAEGFTNYYSRKFLVRSGIMSRDDYIHDLSDLVGRFLNSPGRHMQSAYDSSFDTWIKEYQPTPDSVNSTISYYVLGEIIALAMDVSIVKATAGQKSLDDLMRLLFERYRKDGRGYTEKDILAGLKEISGRDFTEFFDTHVHGTSEIDLQGFLSVIGLRISGAPDSEGFTGLLVAKENGTFVVSGKIEGTPAWESPLVAGDELVAVDGIRFSSSFLGKRPVNGSVFHDSIGKIFSGPVEIAFFHQNLLCKCSYSAVPASPVYTVEKIADGSPEFMYETGRFIEKIISG